MDFNGPSLNLLGFNLDRFLALTISVLSFTNDHILVCAFGTVDSTHSLITVPTFKKKPYQEKP